MKRFLSVLLLFNVIALHAQESFFSQLKPDAYILSENELLQGEVALQQYVSKFDKSTYHKEFSIPVNDRLAYEIGELKTTSKQFSVLSIISKNSKNTKQIELLVIFEKGKSNKEISAIDAARKHWMKLCNTHQVENLVTKLYHNDAYYYNRGRMLKGTKALSNEYSYMNNPNYSLKLTPKNVTFVNKTTAYELGQCSGSYPLPYLLVWKKQSDTTWKILLDSNF